MSTSTPIQYRFYGAATGNGALEVRLRYFNRLISLSPLAGHPPRILHETPPIRLNDTVFHLSFPQLQDPMSYIPRLLSSLNIRPAVSEVVARKIASYIVQISAGNRESNFHILAELDFIRVIWMEEEESMVEETVMLDEAPLSRRGVAEAAAAMERVRKLRSEDKGESLGDCSICLEELSCEKRKVIRIPCGHVYHESCIFKWLRNHNSCPLCRSSLPLQVKLLVFHEILGL